MAETIGKFQILSRISRGGMADVYRCCLRGIGGFEKVVVVKCIRPERASDPSFVSMFLDEARLAANLNHPNIVQVFEIDEADGQPYIAMEYVKGPTFAMLVREARRAGKVNIGHIAKIVSDVCEGLHYVHTAFAPTGQPLGLVHRDVSPQNIIISREGVPKLLDFGVAKADERLTETQAGTLKGKLRYMAPEQLNGTVDQRADVFGAGICLFEATTGQNPYGPPGLSEISLFQNIAAGKFVKPSELVPDYPRDLEAIVLSAIDPDLGKRCPSARVLHDRLERFTSQGPYQSSTRAVAAWVGELFPNSDDTWDASTGGRRRTPTGVPSGRLSESGSRPVPSSTGSYPSFRGGSTPGNVPFAAMSGLSRLPMATPITGVETRRETPPPAMARAQAARARRRAMAVVATAIVVAGAAGGGAAFLWSRRAPSAILASAPVVPPAAASADDAARAYLGAAEGFVATKRYIAAEDLLAKAREAQSRDPALNIRITRLADTLETQGMLREATRHLQAREVREATDMAKEVLERDPGNAEATALLSAARTAQATAARAPAVRADDQSADARRPRGPSQPRASEPVVSAEARPSSAPAEPPAEAPPATEPAPAPPVATAAPAPVEPAPAPAPALPAEPPEPKGIYSPQPRSPVPLPALPRVHVVQSSDDLAHVLSTVEQEAVRAGCSADFTHGITSAVHRSLAGQGSPEIYPSAMYYFIVREAALGREKRAAEQELASAQSSGIVKALNRLPVEERNHL